MRLMFNNLDLQQTPASNPKVMLKIFTQAPGSSAAETHVFSFTSATAARAEADAIKDALSRAIQTAKVGNNLPTAPGGANASSAAMAIASAVSSTPGQGGDSSSIYDDGKLVGDVELQQSLLKANPSLQKMLMESLRTKPESISTSQFSAQFWSSRVHLLRAHAIEKMQTRGSYNVLSTIKPVTVDNATRLSISKEQIQLIFNQHPLIKRVYDENVPKLSEEAFWSRFFQSRLFKKLKGEKITDNDPTDQVLDKYLQVDYELERAQRMMAAHVPHTIDIEGNEENHSQRKGNQPDITMRPMSVDRVPIIRTLNSLSEKLLSQVTPNDIDPSLPIGVDEETYNELALRDLQGDAEENRIILNIKDQSRFFASEKEGTVSGDALLYAKQDPSKVLANLQRDLAKASNRSNLSAAIGYNEDSSGSEDEDGPLDSTKDHVGSSKARSAATTQILSAIAEQRIQSDDISTSGDSFTTIQSSNTAGLSATIFDRLTLTHASTTEFLSHYWSAFLSSDPARADEISGLVKSFERSISRIDAVARDAENERQKEVEKLKRQVRELEERTGRRRKVDYDSIKGGEKAVRTLLAPTVESINVAVKEYRKAFREQTQNGE